MTAEDAIAALDAGLEVSGEPVIFRREATRQTSRYDVKVLAVVRDSQGVELTGGQKQRRRTVVTSPTIFLKEQWCFPPRIGDKLITVDERVHHVVDPPEIIRMGDTVVRINLVVEG